jgi:hypothetical protein
MRELLSKELPASFESAGVQCRTKFVRNTSSTSGIVFFRVSETRKLMQATSRSAA